MRKTWWLSTKRMTVFAVVENNIVIDSSPIIRKFVGQPFGNLDRWLEKQGGYKKQVITV